MQLEDFITNVITNIENAREKTSKELNREVKISGQINFDVAVTIENTAGGTASIKVFEILSGNLGGESKNSSVSRISFSMSVNSLNNKEVKSQRKEIEILKNKFQS